MAKTEITVKLNGDIEIYSPSYNKDLVKDMRRSYRANRTKWNADSNTWTIICGEFETQRADDMNLINRLEREGATITREVSEETEEVAEEAAPSEEIEIAIGGIIEAAKHDTVVEAKTTARANGMSIIQRQCVNCDFACAGKHYDVDGDQLRVIKSECAMLNRNPGHDAYYNWSE